MRSRLGPALPASMPNAASEPWTSDAWRNIPSSWNAIADLDQTAVVDHRGRSPLAHLDHRDARRRDRDPMLPVVAWQTGEWLAAHPYLAWACLGVIWWSCLAPSLIGFGLLLLAAIVAIRQRWMTTSHAQIVSGANAVGH